MTVDHRPDTVNTIDNTAEVHNAEVIAANPAALQQLNIVIVAVAMAIDGDDETHSSKRYRNATFDPFFDKNDACCRPSHTRNRVNRPG